MPGDPASLIYHVCARADWQAAEARGLYRGSRDDVRDGFIHFSTADQVAETARKHFAGQDDLVLVAVDARLLGSALRWERSRGDALFPHLYAYLPLSAVRSAAPLRRAPDGAHLLPELAP